MSSGDRQYEEIMAALQRRLAELDDAKREAAYWRELFFKAVPSEYERQWHQRRHAEAN